MSQVRKTRRFRWAEFPAGQHPLDQFSLASFADTIVRAPGEDAVLVANPADKAIYYYKEGMAAPMGYFPNYGKEPRAVAVIDRTLRQIETGVYETITRIEKPDHTPRSSSSILRRP